MSSWIFIILLFIVQLVIDNYKKKEKLEKAKKLEVKNIENVISDEVLPKSEVTNNRNIIKKNNKKRVIYDRENEILSNDYNISKDTIVNDIIFSEIMDKPKCKR